MIRETLSATLKDAMKAREATKVSTIRMVQAAIKDRDIANRTASKGEAADDEIMQLLAKLIKQREESAKLYDGAARPELAAKEREEIEIIASFLPAQLSDDKVQEAVAGAIAETGAEGLRDMGKVIAVLKEKYAGQMDFAKASAMVKDALK